MSLSAADVNLIPSDSSSTNETNRPKNLGDLQTNKKPALKRQRKMTNPRKYNPRDMLHSDESSCDELMKNNKQHFLEKPLKKKRRNNNKTTVLDNKQSDARLLVNDWLMKALHSEYNIVIISPLSSREKH